MSAHVFIGLSAVFCLAVSLVLPASGAGAVDEELAKELKSLLLQQRQLERSAREYRTSLDAMLAEQSGETGDRNAVTALQNQLDRTERRLAELARRREADIVYRVVVRREGKLVSRSSHSLKSIGKSQYVGKIFVPGGDATITVRRENWLVEVAGQDAADYIVTLDMPDYGVTSLHLIPVEELRATGMADPPAWLPYLGGEPPGSS